ncbi:MAG TPA: tetratricopeptide repeat protein [Opitutaceae bacterium]|nr:tetratricopeptide repeat protein [Opitutaceae bacterium]
MYQRAVAEIKAGAPDAAKVLDELASDAAFDLENRWKAEWSLAQALKVQGAIDTALTRVSRLLVETGEAAARLEPDLRARMAWLQARLAFDAGQHEQALALSERLLGALGNVDPRLRGEIASIIVLLKARAEFALGREPAAVETLKKLREEHPNTDAAIYSYLIEASHYESRGKIVDAQVELTKLTDNPTYKGSKYVPLALFQLALLSEQLGRKENLQEAVKRIEDLITISTAAGESEGDLVFAARMKQGDLFRRLSDFASARRGYEELVNKFPRRPDVVYAQLALAQTLNAQSAADAKGKQVGNNAALARLKFEELRDRVDAPPDVRVEAGYNLGKLLEREGKAEEAMVVWWGVVKDRALKTGAGEMEHTAKRPYWLALTLLDLGELQEQQLKVEEAKVSYLLLLRRKLGHGESIARKALERLGVPTVNL